MKNMMYVMKLLLDLEDKHHNYKNLVNKIQYHLDIVDIVHFPLKIDLENINYNLH